MIGRRGLSWYIPLFAGGAFVLGTARLPQRTLTQLAPAGAGEHAATCSPGASARAATIAKASGVEVRVDHRFIGIHRESGTAVRVWVCESDGEIRSGRYKREVSASDACETAVFACVKQEVSPYTGVAIGTSLDVLFAGEVRVAERQLGGISVPGVVVIATRGREAAELPAGVFHHEVAHELYRRHKDRFPASAWSELLPAGFRYAEGGRRGTDWFDAECLRQGFSCDSAMISRAEDFAYSAQRIMDDPRTSSILASTYPRLRAKFHVVETFYRQIGVRLPPELDL